MIRNIETRSRSFFIVGIQLIVENAHTRSTGVVVRFLEALYSAPHFVNLLKNVFSVSMSLNTCKNMS